MNNEEMIVASSRGDIEASNAVIAYMQTREADILADIAAVQVTDDNYKSSEVTESLKALKDAIEDVRETGKRIVQRSVEMNEAKRVLSQIDSRLWSYKAKADPFCTYAKLSAAYAELKAKVDAFKAAHAKPAPKHTYVIQAELTDDDMKTILKTLDKCNAQYRYAAPQSDAAVKRIDIWFSANM